MSRLIKELKNIKKLMGLNESDAPDLLYHGSIYDFNRFDLSKAGSGDGKDVHGFGIYLTDNQQVAKFYADSAAETRGDVTKYIYTVKLVNREDLLEWENIVVDGYNILNVYKRMQDDDNKIEALSQVLGLSGDYEGDYPYTYSLYDYLSVDLGSKLNASQLLSQAGIMGISFRAKENGMNATNYVIFDTNYLKIVNQDVI